MKVGFKRSTGSIIDRLICFYTEGPYVHCAFLFDDGVWYESIPWKGTRYRYSEDNGTWDFIELNVSKEEELILRENCTRLSGRPYDWLGILLSQIFPLKVDEPKKFYCSEVLVRILHKINLLKYILPTETNPNNLNDWIKKEIKYTKYEVSKSTK